ncbi:MAG: molybdopterin molybdenumtransferase MoeA, partial [Alphaproteobacteria bacterium]|nr:molybdopterin molybdenumtransferase MoeA [Alphaproteobacteria bacterium]
GIVRDDRSALAAALGRASGCDLLLTVGGASVGDRDLVVPALTEAGADIDFWKIAIRPGKPMLSGRLGAMRVIGLPGNPVSAYVCAQLFALPLIRALQGCPRPVPPTLVAATAAPIAANGVRQDHLRARLESRPEGLTVEPAATQDSSMLSVLAASNALIVRPANADAVPAGALVPVLPLDSFNVEI